MPRSNPCRFLRKDRLVFTFTTLIGLVAAVCTTAANLPQLKKAWTTGETDDLSLKMLMLLATGVGPWVMYARCARTPSLSWPTASPSRCFLRSCT